MTFLHELYSSYKRNYNFKVRIVVCSYVFTSYFRKKINNRLNLFLLSPIIILYKFITDFLLKCEIPASTKIGNGLKIHHAMGLVLNGKVELGNNVTLNHNTTIGNKISFEGVDLGSPKIGNNVIVGPNSVIIGPIRIGDNAVIGAGSVVVKDIPNNSVFAGNPSRFIRKLNSALYE